MTVTADYLIIGGGIIGSSIAYHLSQSGNHHVVLCEKTKPPGRGSTFMSGGLVRMHHTSTHQAKLAWSSYSYFRNWKGIIGGDCGFVETGFYQLVGEPFRSSMKQNLTMLKNIGIPTEEISSADFLKNQPFCSLKGVGMIAYEPLGGYADPAQTTISFLQRATHNGLEILEGVQALSLKLKKNRIVGIHSNMGDIEAGEVILCNNFGAYSLIDSIGIQLPLHTKHIGICFFGCDDEVGKNMGTILDDTMGTYYRRTKDGKLLVGITKHPHVDPTTLPPIHLDDLKKAAHLLKDRIPQINDSIAFYGGRSSFDSYTPDKHAVIGRVENMLGLYVATGFSGGGFKIAPAVGSLVADELMSGQEQEELNAFRYHRFRKNRLNKPAYPYENM
ncbi:Glycine/D-amino acid oxidase [Marininema mesophilum]|uniref:Glycine/D-amino acid oxidase n=2 Tax=Marininema mesophilum TaxID=1048340 RepID=A0A1H3C4X6_9BACL|nr:Glycine/D-amino acid oxidase [Marininema mesophilum]